MFELIIICTISFLAGSTSLYLHFILKIMAVLKKDIENLERMLHRIDDKIFRKELMDVVPICKSS